MGNNRHTGVYREEKDMSAWEVIGHKQGIVTGYRKKKHYCKLCGVVVNVDRNLRCNYCGSPTEE